MNIITLFILSLNCVFVVAYTNLALGKTAKASSLESISFKADYAIDGDITTRWGSEERKSNPEWIVVDLGSNIKINKVNIMWESAFARNFEIQVSRNDIDYETVSNVKINREVILDEEAELEDYIQTTTSFATVGARYVKIYCTEKGTLYGYSIYELEIYYINENVPKDTGIVINTGTGTGSGSGTDTESGSGTGTESSTISSESTSTGRGGVSNNDNKGLYFIIIGSSLFLCSLLLLLLAVLFGRRNKKNNDTKKYLEREFKGDYIISPVIPVDPIYEKERGNMSNSNVLNAKEIDITLLNSKNDDNIESRGVNESTENLSNVNESNINESNVNESNVNESNVNESNVNESNVNESIMSETILNESIMNESNNPEVSREVIVQNTPQSSVNRNNNLPFNTPTTEHLDSNIPMISERASTVIQKRINSYQNQPTAPNIDSLPFVITPTTEQPHNDIPMMSEGVPTALSKRMEALQDQSIAPNVNDLPSYSYINNPNNSGYQGSYNQYMYYPNGDIGMMNMNNGMMMNGMNQPYLMNNMNNVDVRNNYGTIPYQNFNNMNGRSMGMNYNNQSLLPSYSRIDSNRISEDNRNNVNGSVNKNNKVITNDKITNNNKINNDNLNNNEDSNNTDNNETNNK